MTFGPRTAISPTPSGATSSSRISTPSIGVPIEPRLRAPPGRLNDATGDVSVSP